MLQVYGRRNSANVQIVLWALNELGVAHEQLDFGFGHASTTTEEFLAKNPMGKVPVIVHDEITMFESAAILRYIGENFGDGAFWPRDTAKRGPLDSWAEWGKNTFATAVLDIFHYDVRLSPETRDPAILEKAIAAVIPLAQILNDRVTERPFVGGDDFTFADVACGHILYRYYKTEWTRPELPALEEYYNRLNRRPAYREHVMVSYEDLRGAY